MERSIHLHGSLYEQRYRKHNCASQRPPNVEGAHAPNGFRSDSVDYARGDIDSPS